MQKQEHYIQTININAKQGDTFVMTFRPMYTPYKAKDLEGATALMQVRDPNDLSRIFYTMQDVDLTVYIAPADPLEKIPAHIVVSVPKQETQAWNWKHAVYDLEVTYASGTTLTEYSGAFNITRDHAYAEVQP
jgi:hypothetical protein